MEYQAINVSGDPQAQARLRALDLLVPALVSGDRGVEAVQLQDVAEFLGRVYEQPAKLSPAFLYARLDVVLSAARRYVRQVPDERPGFRFPDRDRSFRQLAHHVFVIPRMFVEGARSGILPVQRLLEPPEPDTSADALAHFGAETQRQVRDWWREEGRRARFERTIDAAAYYGRRSLHDAFERETWHAAQHTRQLALFLHEMGIEPNGPLGPDDLAGLPLPRGVWDEGR